MFTEIVNLKLTTPTRTDFALQARVKQLRAITMCSAFTPDSA